MNVMNIFIFSFLYSSLSSINGLLSIREKKKKIFHGNLSLGQMSLPTLCLITFDNATFTTNPSNSRLFNNNNTKNKKKKKILFSFLVYSFVHHRVIQSNIKQIIIFIQFMEMKHIQEWDNSSFFFWKRISFERIH